MFSLLIKTDVIHGKLDQRNGRLEVDFAIGRDAKANDVGTIIQTLNDWCEACDSILGAVEAQVVNANNEKERHLKHRAAVEEEVHNIKKTLKAQVNSISVDKSSMRVLSHAKYDFNKLLLRFKILMIWL